MKSIFYRIGMTILCIGAAMLSTAAGVMVMNVCHIQQSGGIVQYHWNPLHWRFGSKDYPGFGRVSNYGPITTLSPSDPPILAE